jgi:CRISPR-associated protein Cst2
MSIDNKRLTHVAGTFLIQADGAFLNGAGLGEGEDRNVTIPKTFRDGQRGEVPYVSAQAWKRWLRTTTIQEAGWPASEPQAIGWNRAPVRASH